MDNELEVTIHDAIVEALGNLADYAETSTVKAAEMIAAEVRESLVGDAEAALDLG